MGETESPPGPGLAQQFTIVCRRCGHPVLAPRKWVHREVECPHCASVIRVPEPTDDGVAPMSGPPYQGPRKVFHFACPHCDSMLEANTGMTHQRAPCPTCNSVLQIPAIDPGSGRPGKVECIEEAEAQLHPMHAYAASGGEAPQIVRQTDGSMAIACPRCEALNEIDANKCEDCGAPFVIEEIGTGTRARSEGYGVASLICGVLSIPLFVVPPIALAAVVLGLFTMVRGRQIVAAPMVGLILGTISLMGAAIGFIQRYL